MKVFCVTSDKYTWALRPFAYLFNKYWGQDVEVVVCGYNPPNFPLPHNFSFYSVSKTGYPQDRWSDAMIDFLKTRKENQFALVLEDYWMVRKVDRAFLDIAEMMLSEDDNILRMDLTTDRMHALGDARDARDLMYVDNYDIITTPHGTPYQMSLQAGVWNKDALLSVLQRGKTPWEVEIYTPVPENMLVFGTRQWPVRYANAVYKGQIEMKELQALSKDDYDHVVPMIPPAWVKEIK